MPNSDTFYPYPLNEEHPYSTHDPLKEKRALRPSLDNQGSEHEGDGDTDASLFDRALRHRSDR